MSARSTQASSRHHPTSIGLQGRLYHTGHQTWASRACTGARQAWPAVLAAEPQMIRTTACPSSPGWLNGCHKCVPPVLIHGKPLTYAETDSGVQMQTRSATIIIIIIIIIIIYCQSVRSCTWRICRRATDHSTPGVVECRALCKLSDWCVSELICNSRRLAGPLKLCFFRSLCTFMLYKGLCTFLPAECRLLENSRQCVSACLSSSQAACLAI